MPNKLVINALRNESLNLASSDSFEENVNMGKYVLPPNISSVAKILELNKSFLGNAASLAEHYKPIINSIQILKDQYRPVFENMELIKNSYRPAFEGIKAISEQYRPLFDSLKILADKHQPLFESMRTLSDQYRPVIESIGKLSQQQRSLIDGMHIGTSIERYRTLFEHSEFGRPLKSISVDDQSVLSSVSVSAVLDELRRRSEDVAIESIESQHHEARESEQVYLELNATANAPVDHTSTKGLSVIPTWVLHFWVYFILSIMTTVSNWETVRASVVDLNARIPQTESFSRIRNFIRVELAGKPGDIRLITGSNVILREGPSMKSSKIMELHKNAVVTVLGKEDRTWLLVSYEHEGHPLEGFISTKFLKKVRKG
ncbi:Bacterial SH3 domain protein [compost metagenome]